MSERKISELIAGLKEYGEKVKNETKEESRAALIDLGVLDVNGNITDEYEGLRCNVQQAS